jgi:hypothetical protein
MTTDTYMNIEQLFIDNMDSVVLLDAVLYQESMPIDRLMYKYYPADGIDVNGFDRTMAYLPLVLMFNGLPDISELQYGTILKIPDISSLLDNLYTLDFSESVPGVTTTVQNNTKTQVQTSNGAVTQASPKLGITLPQVSIDPNTGIITF